MPTHIDRRRFLGLSLAAPIALAEAAEPPPRPVRGGRVVVVGAGLSGLRAARLLKTAGFEVTVMEARATSGGRVRTVRDPFTHGLHAEAGAIRISGAHRRVLTLARQFGLTLLPFAPANGAALMVLEGKRLPASEDPGRAFADLDLRQEERGLEPAALLERYTADIPAALADPTASPTDHADWAVIDRQTWPEWLKARGASPAARALMTLGGDATDLSALYVLRQVALHRGMRAYYKIAGGMDALPKAMASALGSAIRHEAPVVAIDRAPGGMRVTYIEGGTPRTITADHIVLAIPFSVLRDLSIDPPLPPERQRAIRGLAYFPGTRFLFQCRSRFWRNDGLNGAVRTDQPAEMWDAIYETTGAADILGMTVAGEAGRKALMLSEDAALQFGIDLAAASFPAIRTHFERGVVQRWASARWSRGAFAIFRPGQMAALTPFLAAPEDRIHFAGEHTSAWTGWMEGALESAERVANEIMGSETAARR